MEIKIAQRQFSLDDLDLLQQEEDTALVGVKDPAQQEQISREFAARRAALGQPQQYSFTLAPADFVNQMQALDFARTSGLWDGVTQLSAYTYGRLVLLFRITAWSGFEANGEPLPCTPEHKVLVFGQAFGVIQALARKLAEVEEAETKNSGTSAAG